LEKERKFKEHQERIEREKLERDRADKERLEKERQEKDKKERERIAHEEKERAERDRKDKEKEEKEKKEVPPTVPPHPKKLKPQQDLNVITVPSEEEKSSTALSPKALKSPTADDSKGSGEKCSICGKTVYLMDRVNVDGVTLHKACLRCAHCNNTIKPGNFAALGGKFYCKPHFKQLFALKGNYSEGFGEEKPTAKWQNQTDNDENS